MPRSSRASGLSDRVEVGFHTPLFQRCSAKFLPLRAALLPARAVGPGQHALVVHLLPGEHFHSQLCMSAGHCEAAGIGAKRDLPLAWP